MKRVLMIAFHFPPILGSSGVHRTLSFSRYLPEFGWEPIVLTAQPLAYENKRADLMAEIPSGLRVERAFALDAARHLSIFGRYPRALAVPDRWANWRFDAVRRGRRLLRESDIDAIWSSYPIPTAHAIGLALHRASGKPWISDFRDPMAQEGYPADPVLRKAYIELERATVEQATAATLTTPGAVNLYRHRYPGCAGKIHLLENGYDEENFSGAEAGPPLNPGKITLLHSGIVYPQERDPTQLFAALAILSERNPRLTERLRLRFRAPAHEDLLIALGERFGVGHLIELMPPVGYREALNEMLSADALLILQSSGCNEQIPAKLYEYLRVGRPIVALTDPDGDTARCLTNFGVKTQAPLDDSERIVLLLDALLDLINYQILSVPKLNQVQSASRQGRTSQLAEILDLAASGSPKSSCHDKEIDKREKHELGCFDSHYSQF